MNAATKLFKNLIKLGYLFNIDQSLLRSVETKVYLIYITMTKTLNYA